MKLFFNRGELRCIWNTAISIQASILGLHSPNHLVDFLQLLRLEQSLIMSVLAIISDKTFLPSFDY